MPEGPSTQYLRTLVPKTIKALRVWFSGPETSTIGTWTVFGAVYVLFRAQVRSPVLAAVPSASTVALIVGSEKQGSDLQQGSRGA